MYIYYIEIDEAKIYKDKTLNKQIMTVVANNSEDAIKCMGLDAYSKKERKYIIVEPLGETFNKVDRGLICFEERIQDYKKVPYRCENCGTIIEVTESNLTPCPKCGASFVRRFKEDVNL